MSELLSKLSTYNLFNYLLPGVIFTLALKRIWNWDVIPSDIASAIFLYYFIGLVISRVGSLFLEPYLKKKKFVVFADYDDYLKASVTDDEIKTLSEANNMYRTFSSLFICLLGVTVYQFVSRPLVNFIYYILNVEPSKYVYMAIDTGILVIMMTALFLFAYRKQTSYIRKRVIKITGGSKHE